MLIEPGCLPRPISSGKPGSPLLLAAAPARLLQPVEERRPVVVARRLNLRKQPELGTERNFPQNLAEMK